VVEGTPMDVANAKQMIQMVAQDLGVTVDTTKLTQANYTHQYNLALVRAEKQQAELAAAMALNTVTI